MTDISFDIDALLGLAIDEALDEAPACEVPKYAVPYEIVCDDPATWMSTCPLCGFRIAWCTMHHDRWSEITRNGYLVGCPNPDLGGCGGLAQASRYLWEPIG